MVSLLAPEHVVNLANSVLNQAIGQLAFSDRMSPLKSDLMHRVPLIYFMLPSIFNLLIVFLPDATLG
jgi:hypothetical protein